MSGWRDWVPATWRDVVVPRWRGPSSGPAAAVRLESHRFEHGGRHHRVHLREEADGSGLVVADASRLARIDAAGLARLRAALQAGMPDAAAIERELWGQGVLTGEGPMRTGMAGDLASEEGGCAPGVPIVATLEVAADGAEATVARVRRLRDLAIPHVVLRPLGEGAAPAVVAGVRAAEDAGLVAGVAAPADFVDDGRVLDDMAALGLDHVALTLAGPDAAAHDRVLGAGEHAKLVRLAERAASLEVPLTLEVPLLASTWSSIEATLDAALGLGAHGVTAWALVAADDATPDAMPPQALRQAAASLEQAAEGRRLPVTWAAPVRWQGDVRAAVLRGPRTEGDLGLRVTAGGDVLPPRASAASAGSLDATWRVIEASPSWQAFLARARSPWRCDACPGLLACAVDCPASPEGWA